MHYSDYRWLPFEDSPSPSNRVAAAESPAGHGLMQGRMPAELFAGGPSFEEIWEMHPKELGYLPRFGKLPRYQQTYGVDYHFSGSDQRAEPIPPQFDRLIEWARDTIDPRLNGLVINWYDGGKHKIGAHRDTFKQLVPDVPIVMCSLGVVRTLRIRRFRDKGWAFRDFEVRDGDVYLLPYATNIMFTHEITATRRPVGRRISLTLRAFEVA